MALRAFYLITTFSVIFSMQVIPERASVTYVNDRYMYNVTANVRRYNRQSAYYLNFAGSTRHTWGNNVTIHLIFYEFLHNEYKRSFVEMHFKGCDMLNNDPYVGQAIARITREMGIPCPAPPGVYYFQNVTIPTEHFPNVWPFEKNKVEVVLEQTPTKDVICKAVLYAIFKQK